MELIEAAESLFAKKGYEDTAVSEIVKKVEVGQGTFYHYFKSKEDILEAVAEKIVAPYVEDVKNIAKGNEDPTTKINSILNRVLKANDSDLGIMKLMHQKGNHLLHQKVEKALEEGMSPVVTEILSKGTEEGIFKTEYPGESFGFLIASTLYLSHNLSWDHETRKRMKAALEEIISRVLGVNDYRFHLEI
ncbi:TetR/AcrR family transcriptional regulator [Methanosarcina acetivorans]|uniref:TetR/AcrR family transcriptional regulator n=1 Tax=Methanosarcina acetivorans TaxID=2214 RepID=UPI0012FE81FF|nr:TetR/AcrR family transcriptional regulator [Methanosarcina acetivorans]